MMALRFVSDWVLVNWSEIVLLVYMFLQTKYCIIVYSTALFFDKTSINIQRNLE